MKKRVKICQCTTIPQQGWKCQTMLADAMTEHHVKLVCCSGFFLKGILWQSEIFIFSAWVYLTQALLIYCSAAFWTSSPLWVQLLVVLKTPQALHSGPGHKSTTIPLPPADRCCLTHWVLSAVYFLLEFPVPAVSCASCPLHRLKPLLPLQFVFFARSIWLVLRVEALQQSQQFYLLISAAQCRHVFCRSCSPCINGVGRFDLRKQTFWMTFSLKLSLKFWRVKTIATWILFAVT